MLYFHVLETFVQQIESKVKTKHLQSKNKSGQSFETFIKKINYGRCHFFCSRNSNEQKKKETYRPAIITRNMANQSPAPALFD